MRRGYSSGDDRRESKELDILLMDGLNVLTSGLQKGRKGCFWEFLGCHIVLIPFEELPSSSGLVQAVIQSPHLLHVYVLESPER